jgi:hypothetical protein
LPDGSYSKLSVSPILRSRGADGKETSPLETSPLETSPVETSPVENSPVEAVKGGAS